MGFADTNRSFVSTKVAEKEYGLARKFAMWGIAVNFLAIGVLSALLIVFHRQMTYFFTDVESLIPDLSFYILCYGIISP
jgi:Na+-driven multidrug efflux pump